MDTANRLTRWIEVYTDRVQAASDDEAEQGKTICRCWRRCTDTQSSYWQWSTPGFRGGGVRLEAESRAIIEAYADGVKAYVETHRNRLPLAFTILGVGP